MPQWGKSATNAANSVLYANALMVSAVGRTKLQANVFQNTTPNALEVERVVGQFGHTTVDQANSTLGRAVGAHAGWTLSRRGTGDIATAAVNAPGSGFANGETITVGNGSVTGTLVITANATGNMTAVTITSTGAGWVNATVANTNFNREKHMVNISVTGGSGYTNGDIITASNGTVNATATINTNGSGVFGNIGITLTTLGLWANTKANGDVSFAVTNSTGGATTGSGATLVANLGSSTGGSVTLTIGGKAGRTWGETIVAAGSLA
jgi:hypothetical protein